MSQFIYKITYLTLKKKRDYETSPKKPLDENILILESAQELVKLVKTGWSTIWISSVESKTEKRKTGWPTLLA